MRAVFTELGLHQAADDNRRVLAALPVRRPGASPPRSPRTAGPRRPRRRRRTPPTARRAGTVEVRSATASAHTRERPARPEQESTARGGVHRQHADVRRWRRAQHQSTRPPSFSYLGTGRNRAVRRNGRTPSAPWLPSGRGIQAARDPARDVPSAARSRGGAAGGSARGGRSRASRRPVGGGRSHGHRADGVPGGRRGGADRRRRAGDGGGGRDPARPRPGQALELAGVRGDPARAVAMPRRAAGGVLVRGDRDVVCQPDRAGGVGVAHHATGAGPEGGSGGDRPRARAGVTGAGCALGAGPRPRAGRACGAGRTACRAGGARWAAPLLVP